MMQEITSKTNQNLKLVRAVSNGNSDKYILIEGKRLAEEALRSEVSVFKSFISNDFLENVQNNELTSRLAEKSGTYLTPTKFFNSLSDTKTSQGVILLCERPKTSKSLMERALKDAKPNAPIILCLNRIANPNNLGAIFRVAEAADVCGVVISKNSTDPFSPKANRAAMGSNLRLPIWHGDSLENIVDWAKTIGLKTTCADINSETSFVDANWDKKRLLVLGSEAHGFNKKEIELMDEKIVIPMANDIESLNIAVSSGIILFEAIRNR